MNINDVKIEQKKVNHVIKHVFDKQKDLMVKYKDIEGLPDYPFDIDVHENQIWVKDFLWRTTEELAESYECIDDKSDLHFKEELIDALHFATEAMILSGFDYTDVKNIDNEQKNNDPNAEKFWYVTYKFGLVGNCLKNKKWKKTQILTDKNKYKNILCEAYNSLLDLLLDSDMNAEEIYMFYCKKNEVNKFRQRSNY